MLSSLFKPAVAAEPGYYYVPDAAGDPTLPYRVQQVGNTIHVVVKAREAGFARYSITMGVTEVYRGPTKTGPWEPMASVRYRMQYRVSGTWHNVDAAHLENPSLTYAEEGGICTVTRQAEVIGHDATLVWATEYGIQGNKFVAEDRVRCDGFDVATVRRKLRLVKRVTLAADHDGLVTSDDFKVNGQRPDQRKFGKLRLAWHKHIAATGDRPRMRMDKAALSIEIVCHEAGRDDLDVDPTVVVDDANTLNLCWLGSKTTVSRCVARNNAGHLVVLYKDTTNSLLKMAYSTADPPTGTGDWTEVTLVGTAGIIDTNASSGLLGTIVLLPRDDILHFAYNDSGRKINYSQCDVSGGISAIATGSNWKKADGTTAGFEEALDQRGEPTSMIVDSNGNPAVSGQNEYSRWTGAAWSTGINVGAAADFKDMVIDDNDLVYLFSEDDPAANKAGVRTCPFADSATLGNWDATYTEVLSDADRFPGSCVSADGGTIVVGWRTNDASAIYINWSTNSGSTWPNEIDTGASASGKVQIGATQDNEIIALFGNTGSALSQRNSTDGFTVTDSVYGNPDDYYRASIEQHPPGALDEVYVVVDDNADIEIFSFATNAASVEPWWGGGSVAAGFIAYPRPRGLEGGFSVSTGGMQ